MTAQYDGLKGPDSITQPVLHINTQNFLFKHQERTHLVFQAGIPFSELPSVCPQPTQKLSGLCSPIRSATGCPRVVE